MPRISVNDIHNISKTALVQHGALDWISEEVSDAVAASESVGTEFAVFITWKVIVNNYFLEE
jgi:hypothetical protein